ncbi:MAG: polysaccharide deacetylase family protein, partial [Candidatus Paceibacterota bacterium]
RMAFFPEDFVKKNRRILCRILREGHELGIHGWKHRAWTRGLEKINIEKHIIMAKERYERIFGKSPTSFAAPAFRTNAKTLKILSDSGFRTISDIPMKASGKISTGGKNQLMNVPITICGPNKTPIIEYLASKGYSDREILDCLKKEIKGKKFASIYFHDLFECRMKIGLLSSLFEFLEESNIKVKTIEEIAGK